MFSTIRSLFWHRGTHSEPASQRGFMTRLAKDVRANTLVIMGLSLIPLAGMVGGGIDISRMYILKTRLQHACDAGALAGRKAMGSGTWSQTVNGVANYPNAKAVEFFDGNFKTGSYGSYNRIRTFTENAGKVVGSASATIPMTLMKVFQRPDETLTVNCSADMRLPNTDVMFVLDTTGSMGSPQPGDTVSKMDALKVSVKCFYEIVARLDTDANCTTGAPSGGTGSQVQIRFGFVPYATNVNVGRLLKTEWMADSWTYQSREAVYTNGAEQKWNQTSATVVATDNLSLSGVPEAMCNNATAEAYGYNPQTPYMYSNNNTRRTYDKTFTNVTGWSAANGGTCKATQTKTRYVEDLELKKSFDYYRYAPIAWNVSGLKNGTAWNSSIQHPVGDDGAMQSINWDGCIEERATVRATDYDPIPSGAKDLDIDLVPLPGDQTTLWGPALHGLIFPRDNNANSTGNTVQYLTPSGNTYHDIGLVWGARLLSPTGLFASENAFTPQGGEIERHLIFMTDGDACTENYNYAAYGLAWFDRRQTDQNLVPTGGCLSSGTLTEQVNLRTEGLCTAIKNKNITLWVVAFGDLQAATETRLSTCATPGRYFKATSAAALQQTFKQIADQISSLRLTS
jgi:Flp pilus assembly protein TadG